LNASNFEKFSEKSSSHKTGHLLEKCKAGTSLKTHFIDCTGIAVKRVLVSAHGYNPTCFTQSINNHNLRYNLFDYENNILPIDYNNKYSLKTQ